MKRGITKFGKHVLDHENLSVALSVVGSVGTLYWIQNRVVLLTCALTSKAAMKS